jgi:uncharacterized protein (TIGR01777 family)
VKILITGATGFVGKALVARLAQNGHDRVVLSRSRKSAEKSISIPCEIYEWNADHEKAPTQAFNGVDAVFHLAGEPIAARRWTNEQKEKIKDSRVLGTRNLMDTIEGLPAGQRPKAVISASAIGYYGDRGDESLFESSQVGSGFLAEVCELWEKEVLGRNIPEVRTVACRTGIALGKGGGMLEKILPIFQLGLGGPIGNGRQWMSWVHLDDLISLYCEAFENQLIHGAINAVSPHPVTQGEFARVLGRFLHRPVILPVPAFALKLGLGEMSEMLLGGQKVLPEKAIQNGFHFHYPTLSEAFQEIFGTQERQPERKQQGDYDVRQQK